MKRRVTEKGLTIVPYRLIFSERGFVNSEIAPAQGKAFWQKEKPLKKETTKKVRWIDWNINNNDLSLKIKDFNLHTLNVFIDIVSNIFKFL